MTLSRIPQLVVSLTLILLLTLPGATAAQRPAPDVPVEQPPPADAAPFSPYATRRRRPTEIGTYPRAAARCHRGGCCPAGQRRAGRLRVHVERLGTPQLDRCQRGNQHRHQQHHCRAGPIDIGFPFKFYENTQSQLYISRFGYLTFNNDNLGNSQSEVPSPEKPDEVIAPHWAPMYEVGGYVRYLRGGTALTAGSPWSGTTCAATPMLMWMSTPSRLFCSRAATSSTSIRR